MQRLKRVYVRVGLQLAADQAIVDEKFMKVHLDSTLKIYKALTLRKLQKYSMMQIDILINKMSIFNYSASNKLRAKLGVEKYTELNGNKMKK